MAERTVKPGSFGFPEGLLCPGDEFSPMPFWFFNDDPEQGRVRRELERMHEKGIDGFVLHPRIGVPPEIPYLSEAFFEAVTRIVETADSLGMKVILYDEGMYPSGSAGGLIVKEDGSLASRGIRILEAGECPEADREPEIVADLGNGRRIVYEFTRGTIRGIHFGEDDGEENAPPSADILNPRAVERFIALTHERYYAHLARFFGSVIIGIFTDEPNPLGRNAEHYRQWYPGLKEELEAAGGKVSDLEYLFPGKDPEAGLRTRLLYRSLLKAKLRKTYYQPLSRWCEDHGIGLMGHPESSDDVEEEFVFAVPGQDLIARRVVSLTGGLREFDAVQAHLAADIAAILGRRRNLNECFGDCNRERRNWFFTGADLFWYTNWLALRGTNLFIPHAFFFGIEGGRGEDRPPDVGLNSIWEPYWDRIALYMKRLAWLGTDSRRQIRAAVLCDNNRVPGEEIACLYEHQVDFRYLPLGLLDRCRIENGRLMAGEDACSIVLNTLGQEAGEEFARHFGPEGARLLTDRPDEVIGAVEPVLTTPAPEPALRAIRLSKEGADLLLVSNEGNTPIETRLSLPGNQGFVIGMDPWSGRIFAPEAGEDGILLRLERCAVRLYLLNGNEADRRLAAENLCPDAVEYLDITERLTLDTEGENTKVYACRVSSGEAHVEVFGEEMAECFCNGEFAGFSLVSPHRFDLTPHLRGGENGVTIRFTGNAANLHNPDILAGRGEPIPFGAGVAGPV